MIVPYGDEDRKLMWRILDEWARSTKNRNSGLERQLRTTFKPLNADALKHQVPQQNHPMRLHESGWLVGEGLEHQSKVIPVITFEAFGSPNEVKEAAFRVSLLSIRGDELVAVGWRFEQAEQPEDGGDMPAHPYAHAQASTGWEKSIHCLIHPPHGDGESCTGLNEVEDQNINRERSEVQALTLVKHPAFPLGVKTLTGLSLALYVTLYGAPQAQKTFGKLRPLIAADGDLADDLGRLCLI